MLFDRRPGPFANEPRLDHFDPDHERYASVPIVRLHPLTKQISVVRGELPDFLNRAALLDRLRTRGDAPVAYGVFANRLGGLALHSRGEEVMWDYRWEHDVEIDVEWLLDDADRGSLNASLDRLSANLAEGRALSNAIQDAGWVLASADTEIGSLLMVFHDPTFTR